MPLINKKSKKAFKHNVEAEMHAGKPQDQALAIAYSVKRKAKKAAGGTVKSGSHDMDYAKGGEVSNRNESAKYEQRPSIHERDNDRAMVSRNSGNKPLKNDSWTDNPTIKQAQKGPKTTPIKHPKMVPQSLYTARLRSEEDHLQEFAKVNNGPQIQPPKEYDELDAKKQGHNVRDNEKSHSTRKPPYRKAIEDQYSEDVAEPEMYAKGGQVEQEDYLHPDHIQDSEELDGTPEHGIEERERADEHHLQSRLDPSEDEGEADAHSRNEERPDRQGPRVSDMEAPHNKYQRSAYAQGGEIELHHDMDEQPLEEAEIMKEASLAAAIMAKRRKLHQDSDSDIDHEMYMAEGGEIHSHPSIYSDDSDQVDLSRNADEDANEEDQVSFNALRKENYSESEGLRQLDQPEDSNLIDDPREEREENIHDRSIVGQIRKKMRMKSPISR